MTVELSANKPTVAVFSAGVVLMTMVLITTAGNSPTLTTDFKLGCSVITGLSAGRPCSQASINSSPTGW
jgi:hypothetical protein